MAQRSNEKNEMKPKNGAKRLVKSGVGQHEKKMHPGKKLTKLKLGK